mgnify:FL=1
MNKAKRINISLNEKEYGILETMAVNNGLKPTTLGALIVKKELRKYKDDPSKFDLFE